MASDLEVLRIPAGPEAVALLPHLARVLDGQAPPSLPVPADDPREIERLTGTLAPGSPIEHDAVLVLATSGSTGVPKGALLTAAALRASAAATHSRLGGVGTWLLALPAHHVAGMQVLLRSVAAGTEPVVLDVRDGFDPAALPAAIAAMSGPRRYTSLVPTQLVKALADPDATAALASLDAVLLGGAATPAPLLARATAASIPVVRTYGMSETCGGCVYDGVPLDGVRLRLGDEGRLRLGDDGRVSLGGPTLAAGYRGMPDHPAFAEPGWFRTDDVGRIGEDGRLRILGRVDDAISTAGLTVVPRVVEDVVTAVPGVAECVVVGVPDERLGARVAALVVLDAGATVTDDAIREHVASELGREAVPRVVVRTAALPVRGPGKVDRAAALRRVMETAR
ncbi:o-succinylbenzoate--CoA ligase [Rhodococcoides corynebacterioides]|uniref:o-succinylbenzoate--CoA ligase n=1 Tax=Rhodococcoides corynebacterioides TaxID=53972 RepID=UPI003F8024F1